RLGPRQHDGEAARRARTDDSRKPWKLHAQNPLVEKKQRRERLVLRGGGDVALIGERGEKGGHVGASQLAGMALAMEDHIPAHPVDVGLLRSPTVVQRPYM